MTHEHKPECEFKDYSASLYCNNPNGPDERMSISIDGFTYDENVHSNNSVSFKHIPFHYCPSCGISLRE